MLRGQIFHTRPGADPMRQYAIVTALIFTVVAVLQLARAFYGWPVTIASIDVPVAASWVAAAIAGILAIAGFMTARG
jgi:hypothetical protein